jgi:hypothetical protein
MFVDDTLIASLDQTRLELHHPRPAETAIRFDQPWEGRFSGYVTVIQDVDRYRLYYRGLPEAGRDGTDSEVTCYAESTDGIHWSKPELGLYEWNGSRHNNIVLMGEAPSSHNFAPFMDVGPHAAKTGGRYKALAGTAASGLLAWVSRDGIRWKRLQPEPVIRAGAFDSQNVSFWSPSEQKYVCYFRTWTEAATGRFRTISRTTSDDFVDWCTPVPMDFGDTPQEHLYTNQTVPYFRAPHIYIGLAARFMPGRKVIRPADEVQVDPRYAGDCSDSVLLSSRGGNRYDRQFMESFLRPGPGPRNWVSRSNYLACGIVPTGQAEMSIYLSRDYGQPTAHLQRFVLRTDGFVSVAAGYPGGSMSTRPLKFSLGRELTLNVSTSAAGYVQVGLQDAGGKEIPGFTLDDCDEIVGDRIEQLVSWRGQTDLSQFSGQPICLQFRLKDADLYSFRFR